MPLIFNLWECIGKYLGPPSKHEETLAPRLFSAQNFGHLQWA